MNVLQRLYNDEFEKLQIQNVLIIIVKIDAPLI